MLLRASFGFLIATLLIMAIGTIAQKASRVRYKKYGSGIERFTGSRLDKILMALFTIFISLSAISFILWWSL